MNDFISYTIGILLTISIIIDISPFIKRHKKETKIEDKTQKSYVELLMQMEDPYQKVNGIIDSFIDEASNNYLIFSGHTREDYMNQEFVEEYEKYVIAFLQKNMSPTVRDTIGLCYNIKDNEGELYRILKLRTKLYLIGKVSENNVSLPD